MAWFRRRSAAPRTVESATTNRRFAWLGGRRVLADAPYVLPSDDQEINRLDFQHYMLRYALRGNYAAPLNRPTSILDVGCGTERWALEMAQLFPDANVIGTDLVTPKVDSGAALTGAISERPANYTFVQANVLEGLPFADGSFDYVHARLLLFAISADRWPTLARELIRVTKPGGWVESVETGPQRDGGPAMDALVRWIVEASTRRGVDSLFGPKIGGVFREAGLVESESRDIALPVGRYGGRLGAMAATDVFAVVNGIKPLVVAQGITTLEAYEAAVQQAQANLDRMKCTLPFYITYGKRPR